MSAASSIPPSILLLCATSKVNRVNRRTQLNISGHPMAILIFVSLLLVLNFHAGRVEAQDGRARFAYDGSITPQKWGDLSPQYALCATGTRQSPIDIVRSAAVADPNLKPLGSSYNPGSASLIDNGFNVMLKYGEDVGVIVIDGKKYKLQQLHWHSPSEHTIDGVQYPVEMHLVHLSETGDISVVAVLYKYGRADPFLSQLAEKMTTLMTAVKSGNPHANVSAGLVSTRALTQHTNKYYRYVGSLTTPPCTEGVTWNILGKVMEMSIEQASSLTSLLEDDCRHNARPTQPLLGRRVLLCNQGV
ncbi:alpha carbonic anhydrase 1, chloroplastic-like [Wolffia australiana]